MSVRRFFHSSKAVAGGAAESILGPLPEWNLDDLYRGLGAPALARDLALADSRSVDFETRFKGKLVAFAEGADAGARLAEAVVAYENLEELLGRIVSFAGLVHAGNTGDPVISKFYGDVQEKITAASSHLLFFSLELNRIADEAIETAMADPALGHYRPWIEDVRAEKPYQLEDRIEQLFHEKSVTGQAAWNRLFDDTVASLRFKAAVEIFITAQEILVDNASYPTETIGLNSHLYRPLGLGFANLGSLIMSYGMPYDSDGGRALAAAVKHLEAIDDLMGRLASFAQLVYTGNTADPARASAATPSGTV